MTLTMKQRNIEDEKWEFIIPKLLISAISLPLSSPGTEAHLRLLHFLFLSHAETNTKIPNFQFYDQKRGFSRIPHLKENIQCHKKFEKLSPPPADEDEFVSFFILFSIYFFVSLPIVMILDRLLISHLIIFNKV